MPPRKNIKKGAAAQFQNCKEIDRAMKSGATFGAVTRRVGNSGFTIQLSSKKSVMGTPRGLFSPSTMRINVGQLVIVVGTDRPEGDLRPALPWEIVALIDDKSTADSLVKKGVMPAEVMGFAASAGAMASAAVVEDDLFDAEDSDEDFWTKGAADVRGGLKAERKAQEAAATISARVASLKGGKSKKGVDGGVAVGDLADPTLLSDLAEQERFKRWRAHKAKTAVTTSGSAVVTARLTTAELVAQFEAEAEAARLAAENAAAAALEAQELRTAEVKVMLANHTVKENWDDEDEIDLNDL